MKIKHKVLKNAEGKVIGISVKPDGESWGERFCNLFPKAFLKKEAVVRIEGDKIVFDIKSLNEQFIIKPKNKDLEGLLGNVFSWAQELIIEPINDPDSLSDPGFMIFVKK